LRDAFVDGNRVFGVVNTRLLWHREKEAICHAWCFFGTHRGPARVVSTYPGLDAGTNNAAAECVVPFGVATPRVSFVVECASVRSGGPAPAESFLQVPICRLPVVPRVDAAMCTQLRAVDSAAALSWVAWHAGLGVDRFYVYVNERNRTALRVVRETLARSSHAALVEVVDWGHALAGVPEGAFYDQHAHQLSCALRARGRARWLGFNDVDERFVLLNPFVGLADWLDAYPGVVDKTAHVMFCNKVFRGANATSADKCTPRYALGKFVARPELVQWPNVHLLLQDSPRVLVHEKDGFSAHLKPT
jgi:hypothetical protein